MNGLRARSPVQTVKINSFPKPRLKKNSNTCTGTCFVFFGLNKLHSRDEIVRHSILNIVYKSAMFCYFCIQLTSQTEFRTFNN